MTTTSSDPALLYQTLPQGKLTFGAHPRALRTLFLTEMWERFSYYGMRAILILYLTAALADGGLGFDHKLSGTIYGLYTAGVYFVALPGGYIADTYLGQRKSVMLGGIVIAIGHFCLALPAIGTFYAGLSLIVLGTGLLKPNVSTLVGGLYAPDDARRDGGFSIFYMGINLGGLFAPLVCGYLAQDKGFLAFLQAHGVNPHTGWHFGFAAAGLGMTFGVLQFFIGLKNFGEVGERPSNKTVAVPTIGTPTTLGAPNPLTRDDWSRLAAIAVLFVFSTLFWAAYEQAGSTLNEFANDFTANRIFGWEYPSSWLQAVNSIFVIALAPVFGVLWVKMGSRQPSSPTKFALALLAIAASFFLVAGGALIAQQTSSRVSPMWLIGVYLLSTIGELCLSPVGLSTTTKLAPARFASLMMGAWFLSLSAGNALGGFIETKYDPAAGTLPFLFLVIALVALVAAVVLALLIKPIRKLMAGVN